MIAFPCLIFSTWGLTFELFLCFHIPFVLALNLRCDMVPNSHEFSLSGFCFSSLKFHELGEVQCILVSYFSQILFLAYHFLNWVVF